MTWHLADDMNSNDGRNVQKSFHHRHFNGNSNNVTGKRAKDTAEDGSNDVDNDGDNDSIVVSHEPALLVRS